MKTLDLLESKLGVGRIKQQEPLAKLTTLKVGGEAQFYFIAQSTKEVEIAIKAASEAKIHHYILGSGSNVIISDRGLEGLVIRNESRSINIVKRLGTVKNGKTKTTQALVEVDTGTLVNTLVRYTCDEGLGGLERHLGLPGTVGGALYMNSKWTNPVSYVGDVLYQARVIDDNGEIKVVDQKYFDFGYDQSILQKTHEVVLSATFLLTAEDKKILWERAHESLEYRKRTQPMGVATAGCTFRNISLADAMKIPTPNHTKSAGFLVDQVGLKGFQIGKMKLSDHHANFMINLGDATASDAKALIDEAKRRVKEKFAVDIEPEVVLMGDFS